MEREENVGRIIFSSKEQYKVQTSKGVFKGVLKGKFVYEVVELDQYPCVGDYVKVQYTEDSELVMILEACERKNKISRKVRGTQIAEQVIACNVDAMILCLSANDNFSMARVERYLYAFACENVKIVVVLTKADLAPDIESYISQVQEVYKDIEVIPTSIYQEEGKDKLLPYLKQGLTSVVIGSSGVGKSTLVNHLVGREVLQTGGINDKTSKGKHTTTFRQLVELGEGFGAIIDTPGMRSVSLWHGDENDTVFSDIEELKLSCKFSNCSHTTENGCAILAAITRGELSKSRYQSYVKLKKENAYIERKISRKSDRQESKKSDKKSGKVRNKRFVYDKWD
jgi:ribosome biogenesis GTPase